MIERLFEKAQAILHIPVTEEADFHYVKVSDRTSGELLHEYYIALSPIAVTPDFYCPLYLYGYEGRDILLSCEDEDAPETLFNGVLAGGTIEERSDLYPDIYHEPLRQKIHFSSRRGWLNDPNGLCYEGGEFHMCYQHNPFGSDHGGVNISWGLAISPDGVHFHEYPDAITPRDAYTHIASGSAIVDTYNLSGKGAGTILATFTALQSALYRGRVTKGNRGQMLYYSTDHGHTFKSIKDGPIIPVAEGECWRDPKILQIDEKSFCIAVYETFEGKNCVSFYSSNDCLNWKFETRTMDLYECPDLFPLKCVETGETLWVLYGGNGMYRIGRFENYAFTQTEESRYLDYGNSTYAGQTFNSHPDTEGRYHVAWMTGGREAKSPFSQSMTVLCRFTLHKTERGYFMYRNPIDALASLRNEKSHTDIASNAQQTASLNLSDVGDAELLLAAKGKTELMVRDVGFTFDPSTRMLSFTGGKEYRVDHEGDLPIRIITDKRSVEFFVAKEISASFISVSEHKELTLASEEARASADVWTLSEIWNG